MDQMIVMVLITPEACARGDARCHNGYDKGCDACYDNWRDNWGGAAWRGKSLDNESVC